MAKRPGQPLTATFCNRVSRPGRYGDGRGGFGLYLRVYGTASGRVGRSWGQRLRINGRVTCLGLGSYPAVTLKEARRRALANAQAVQEGDDPRQDRTPTFAKLSEKVIALHAKSWKPGSRRPKQWRASLAAHSHPVIGDKSVGDISRADILAIVAPIWHEKPSMAAQVLRRVGVVLRYAVAQGLAEHNVAEPSAIRAALPRVNGHRRHHRAVPHREVSDALAEVRAGKAQPAVKLALEFLVLTACRPSEVTGATWSEMDREAATWTIPRERIKAKREHRVPLSHRALEVLAEARELSGDSEFVFANHRTGRPYRPRGLRRLLVKLDIEGTPHGFRSSFRDWCAETGVDRAAAEAALAHVVGGVEGAYMRSDLFDRRRRLMQDWAAYCGG